MQQEWQPVPGFLWCGQNIHIKDGTLDFGAIFSQVPCRAAGVFTRNNLPGAPIIVGKQHIADGRLQAIVVNSKNANVATGQQGIDNALKMCQWTAAAMHIAPELVLPSSTGVIGWQLPMEKIRQGCERLPQALGATAQHVENFNRAIMTTDAFPKYISTTVGPATIMGIAKGAGMIEPNMATMLCYFATDALIPIKKLKPMLKLAVNCSFNRISVDTDTSTSDTVVLLSNGLAGKVEVEQFEAALTQMSIALAKSIVRDGEGATKLIELTVSGATSAKAALTIAKSVVNSPLVRTAIYGGDPNWGRFVMAIGKVFAYPVPLEQLKIYFGQGPARQLIDFEIVNRNAVPLQALSALLKQPEVYLEIVIGQGPYRERVWGCDLTEKYIAVNAYYTT